MFTLLSFLAVVVHGCHPECLCEDLSTVAPICTPVCQEPQCIIQCNQHSGTHVSCTPLNCNVTCPVDQCEADSCPQCETVCGPIVCSPETVACTPLCEETQCTWSCTAPLSCVNANCTEPACSSGTVATVSLIVLFLFILLFL